MLKLYQQHCDTPSFIAEVVEACSNDKLQNSASWLLKHHLEAGIQLDSHVIAQLYEGLPQLASWQAKLHILQSMPFMPIDKTRKTLVEHFLRDCLTNTNKFIRAWAYNGFHQLALQFPEYQQEAHQFFDMALRDEAPSVKARIRNTLKNSR